MDEEDVLNVRNTLLFDLFGIGVMVAFAVVCYLTCRG